MNRTPAVSGRLVWVGAALVVGATAIGLWSLGTLLAPGPWNQVALVAVALVAAVTATARAGARSRLAPSGWGLATGVAVLASLYLGPGTTPTLPLPTPESLDRFVRLARSGIDAVVQGHIPVEPSRGLELLVVSGAVAVFLLADLLALGLGRAGLAGLALLGLWLPTILFEIDPGFFALALGGMAWLLLLAVTRPRVRQQAGLTPDVGPVMTAAAAVAVAAVVAGPVAAAMPFYGSLHLPGTVGGGGIDGPLRLSTDLDMRSSLSQRSDRTVLTYTTDATSVGPLRMYTMVDFDGREWVRGDRGESLEPAGPDAVLWPSELAAPAELDLVTVRVGDLDQDRLPIPVEPRTVEAPGSWVYDALRDEVIGTGSTSTQDTVYEVQIAARDLTPDTLRADGAGEVIGPDAAELAVAESAFTPEVRALAQEITRDATNQYDRALALQSFFRDVQNFSYDTQVPPAQTDDAVWDFLNQRTGYCVQYASAMAVMARTLGIPARLAVGFLPGRPSEEVRGEFVVSGRQAHAWPELFFAGAGWVRFEPTPAVQTGAPPIYADPFAGTPVSPEQMGPTGAATSSASAGAQAPQQNQGGGNQVGIGTASVPLELVAAVLVVVVGLLVALVLALLRRRRRRHPPRPRGAEQWWARLRTTLAERGVTWTDATTPRQAAEVVREHLRDADAPPEVIQQAIAALGALLAAVEASRYAPQPGQRSDEELGRWVEEIGRPLAPAVTGEPARAGR